MEYICINCDKCDIVKHQEAILIDFNYDDIKNIIISNYVIFINTCNHNNNALTKILKDLNIARTNFGNYSIDIPNYTKPAKV